MHSFLNDWGAFFVGVGTVLTPVLAWVLNRRNQKRQAQKQYNDAIEKQAAQHDAMEKYFTEAIQRDNQDRRQEIEELKQQIEDLKREADEVQATATTMELKWKEQIALKDKEIASLKRRLKNAQAMLRKHNIKMEED